MPFDPTTAKPVDAAPAGKGTFDPATAKSVDAASEGFPYDRPGTTYGGILPFAKDEKTGALSLAAPEIIRSPVRGALEYWERAKHGFQPTSTDEPPATQPSPDMLNAVMAFGGMRAAPGAGKAGFGPGIGEAAPEVRPNAISPERAALAKEAIDKYGIPITGPQIGMNPTTKFAESTVRHLPFSGAGSEEAAVRQAFNSAVAKTFGEDTLTITQAVMDRAKTRLGATLGRIEDANQIKLDQPFLDQFAGIEAEARSSLTDEEYGIIKRQVENSIAHIKTGDTLEGATYGKLMHKGSPLDRAVESDNSNVAFYAGKIKAALQDALQRSLSPEDARAYTAARFQYKNMKTIEPLVNKSPDGNISPALLNGRVSAQFPNRAYETSGNDLDRLAKIGQAFLKEPGTSGSSERGAVKAGLVKAGELGAAAAAGSFAGIVPTAIGAGTVLGAGRLAGNYLRSPGLAQRTIAQGLRVPKPPLTPPPSAVRFAYPYSDADDALNNRTPTDAALNP